ncbi:MULTISPECIES: thiolase family protein [unclassified Neptuniibacter]|uniref:thiolase family protein n=1 Tax=unclassified Neptuniibacter TaxID=2630693 RepID=UPI000C48A633|nr:MULTISPECIES: thiolase family protein [unclassified Neptuniibacter]MAY41290.1 acetyl-CoA C-acyltransferase [Oceanospirillaceae bacterium]|tara:strand:+ start:13237 stop:14406 length:1170 start_codon:yes stop_codon:yes gene_type:complete
MCIDPVVIVSAKRTPIGKLMGCLSYVSAPYLGAAAISGAINQAAIEKVEIDEVLMGCVLSAGLGQAPARQASRLAGLPDQVGCTTVNKMCGSGMKALMLAHDQLMAGSANIMVAGGMESMSQAPHLLAKARKGLRLGHAEMLDHMFVDGLEDAYDGRLMGELAQECADKHQIGRVEMDDFAIASLSRAITASQSGAFDAEISSLKVGEIVVDRDELPPKADVEMIRHLKAVFKESGTLTAANSSSISDGAAALILMRESEAKRRGLDPLVRIVAHATHAQLPAEFPEAVVAAIEKVLMASAWTLDDVDLYEINEAFAATVLLVINTLGLDRKRVNVHGGACALGHPIGASGARIIVTLLHALEEKGLQKGLAAVCIGGGEATALTVERV